MYASNILGLIALFTTGTNALPAGNNHDDEPTTTITRAPELVRRADPTAVWVSVDDEGQPAETLTPSISTGDDGKTHMVDAAPHDITASVFTELWYGKMTTSTGDPPNPTATNKNGEGAFARCYQDKKEKEDMVTVCTPAEDSTLYQDETYFVTWDPDFFNKTDTPKNTTYEIAARLDYLNRTGNSHDENYDPNEGKFVKLFETDPVKASWGYLPLRIRSAYLKGSQPHNITLKLMLSEKGKTGKDETSTPMPLVLDKRRLPREKPHHVDRKDLLIALPITVGAIIALVVAIFLWNRKTRRIQLGNIMSRNRNGYTGRKTRNLFNRNKDAKDGGAIRLEEHSAQSTPLYEYSDHAVPEAPRHHARRDSDLGSLAGSPVTPTFHDQDTNPPTGGNAFRDELRRQDEQRRNEF